MTQTIIPTGYRVTISSWENDADACQDKILEGLSKERVQFLVALCTLFRSKSRSTKTQKYYGNMYEPELDEVDEACEAITEVMKAHREALEEHEREVLDENDLESIADCMGDLLGELLGRSEFYWVRVFDDMKIEYTPVEIVLEDVTAEFL